MKNNYYLKLGGSSTGWLIGGNAGFDGGTGNDSDEVFWNANYFLSRIIEKNYEICNTGIRKPTIL